MTQTPGFIAVYRWKIAEENVAAFRECWRAATRELGPHGIRGSLFARADDGTFCAIALWPDRETRDRAFADVPGREWPPVERLEPILLSPLDNLWKL
ncbi:hypothetical protein [Qipengyuania sp. JC766]|uniref:hypothetical protein n=1 Tax=Qipengyuania sp. JC766 TaxID=3232139 RepID=UPI003459B57D